ncbi:MAG: 9-O-acetylesterase [Bacteroidetes bacterium HGW-Bacteroidetes-4]|jgi:sialate O-acetylesterase|nr:MAG: 9-O-acetylesterase [Bacteroidetes bacterium HGW-Bacteroidetes-4]
MKSKRLLIGMFAVTLMIASSCTKTTFVEPDQLFTDNLVLQQNSKVNIWGIADPGAKLTIKGSWGSQTSCSADKSGKWLAKLATTEAGGPYELSISSGKINRTFTNLMLGEVWVCSGQSNMEMPLLGNWAHVNNAEQEAATADYPAIRLFTVQKNIAFNQIDTIGTQGWQVCDSNTVKDFSATAYFFGRKLHKKLDVPIGLIHTSWGGTVAEAWTSKQALLQMPDFAEQVEKISSLDASRDSLMKKFEADTRKMMQEIAAADPGFEGTNVRFAAPDLDDSNWMPIDFPKLWEETGLGNYDGSGWFRKTIMLTVAVAESELTLYYGAPDDYDEAWFNGVKVGENKEWGKQRVYKIPKGVARVGKNVITLRVYDYTGGGGFMGEPKDYQLVSDKGISISLAKGWKAKKGFDFEDIATRPVSLFDPNQPTVLYNAMIHPLIPYTIQGAIWYQGESNAGRAFQYRDLFKTMIQDWRSNWNQGDFPFYFVQLASYMPRNENPIDDTWAELREAQTLALELPNTGMAVTIDIGDAKDIHPGNKQDVGKRLALNALAKTYRMEIPYSGPMYQSHEIKGNSFELSFDFVYEGLSTSDGRKLTGFAIAGADKKFYWAEAKINGNKVMVSSAKVLEPVAVRYAWSSNPECNLVNSAGLPTSPFRTDNWRGITQP